MGRLIMLVLVAIALVHGFFYLSYGTLDPCKAGAFRMINDQSSEAAQAVGQLVAEPVENRLRSKGVLTCYKVALFGEDPETLLE